MSIKRFTKYPSEVIDYDFDFTLWLADRGNDTIVSFEAFADPGVLIAASVQIGSIVRVFVGSGDSGNQYRVAVEIVTAGGRTKVGEIYVRVQGLDLPGTGTGGGIAPGFLGLDGGVLSLDGLELELA